MSFVDLGGVLAGNYQQTDATVTLDPDKESPMLKALNHYPVGAIFVPRITHHAPGKWKLLPKKKKYHFEAKIFASGGINRPLSISENRIYAFVKAEDAEICATHLPLDAAAFGGFFGYFRKKQPARRHTMGTLDNPSERNTYGDYRRWSEEERWELIDGGSLCATGVPSRTTGKLDCWDGG